jgi:hypothetical protein
MKIDKNLYVCAPTRQHFVFWLKEHGDMQDDRFTIQVHYVHMPSQLNGIHLKKDDRIIILSGIVQWTDHGRLNQLNAFNEMKDYLEGHRG